MELAPAVLLKNVARGDRRLSVARICHAILSDPALCCERDEYSGGAEVAIQFAVPLTPVRQHEDQETCRGSSARTKFGGSRVCSNRKSRTIQSRGPLHDCLDSNKLVVRLLPLVRRVALQLRGHLPAHVELDDLVSEGIVGLIDAVKKFDPVKGVTIESYARYRIRGAILDSLRDQDHASRDMRRRIKKIMSASQDLEFQLGRPAGDAEMAQAMGLSLAKWYERVAELRRLGFDGSCSRISQEVPERIDEENLADSPDEDPFALCYRREQRDILSRALGCLTERERSIITLYYRDAVTMKQIGNRLGIDESRVSQLHSGALARLRTRVAAMLHPSAPISGRAWAAEAATEQA